MRTPALVALVATAALAGAAGGAGTALAGHLFPDVPHDSAHAPGITWAAERGLLVGHADRTFRPTDPVQRGQLATVLMRQGAWRGPVITMTPVCGTLDMAVVDHASESDAPPGSGEATVEWSVDGGSRHVLTPPFRTQGRALVFTVDQPGVVSFFVDGTAWAHAPTAERCEPSGR